MKKHLITNSILIFAVLSTMTVACRRLIDADIQALHEETENGKSPFPGAAQPPAYHIAKSEKLVIPDAIQLPANLPAGNGRVATLYAEGVQKYRAQQKAGSNPATYEWVFVAPQADLYDVTNKKIGSHSAGPTWQLFGSADSIFAQQFSPPKAVASPDAASIDWLLLMPKTGKTPTGIFANVSYIQRIATQGGKAPTRLPVNASETVDVKYTAVYRFTKVN